MLIEVPPQVGALCGFPCKTAPILSGRMATATNPSLGRRHRVLRLARTSADPQSAPGALADRRSRATGSMNAQARTVVQWFVWRNLRPPFGTLALGRGRVLPGCFYLDETRTRCGHASG
jgi:hypothetical protein